MLCVLKTGYSVLFLSPDTIEDCLFELGQEKERVFRRPTSAALTRWPDNSHVTWDTCAGKKKHCVVLWCPVNTRRKISRWAPRVLALGHSVDNRDVYMGQKATYWIPVGPKRAWVSDSLTSNNLSITSSLCQTRHITWHSGPISYAFEDESGIPRAIVWSSLMVQYMSQETKGREIEVASYCH